MDFFVAQCSKLSDILELLIKSQKYKLGKGIYHDHLSTTPAWTVAKFYMYLSLGDFIEIMFFLPIKILDGNYLWT
jgi:hypothetical protein